MPETAIGTQHDVRSRPDHRPGGPTLGELPGRRWLRAVEPLVALILTALVFSFVQTGRDGIIEEDSFYHIKVAALVREHGPRLDFPWLRFTILNESSYTDHHLLFHILQAPFTFVDLQLAAKTSAVAFATLAFWGCYLILVRSRVRWAFGWLVVMLAVAHTFLWRQSMARPQSLALLLL